MGFPRVFFLFASHLFSYNTIRVTCLLVNETSTASSVSTGALLPAKSAVNTTRTAATTTQVFTNKSQTTLSPQTTEALPRTPYVQELPKNIYRVNYAYINPNKDTSYPALYPFQKEKSWYTPAVLPEPAGGTISYWVNSTYDPFYTTHGGFGRSLLGCNPTSHPPEYRNFASCPGFSGFLVKRFNMKTPFVSTHCESGFGPTGLKLEQIKPAVMEGIVHLGKKVKCSPVCCKHMVGKHLFLSNDQNKLLWDARMLDGMCPHDIPHEIYCSFWGYTAYYPWGCNDTFISDTQRDFITPCYDYIAWWFSTYCKYYKVNGFRDTWEHQGYEPSPYYDTLSAEQVNTNFAIFMAPDRICHPLTYYFPEAKVLSMATKLRLTVPLLLAAALTVL